MELDQADLDQFRNLVGARLGLQFTNGKKDLLADVLRQRPQVLGYPGPRPYLRLITVAGNEEWRALATHLTVTETYFFRGPDQFRALAETAIPERLHVRGRERRFRVLSAGCASGEEAYSLAILLKEQFPALSPSEVEIVGLDLNPAMIAKAKQARYQRWSPRETPNDLRDKYFRTEGTDLVLADRFARWFRSASTISWPAP